MTDGSFKTVRTAVGRALDYSPRKYAALVFAVALVLRTGYWLNTGTITPASGRMFLTFCGPLWSDPIGLFTTPHAALAYTNWGIGSRVLYAGYWVPLCVVTSLPGSSPDVMIALQILLSALACVLVFDAGRRHTNLVGGLVAGFALAVLMDVFAWTTRILGDSLLVFVLTLAIWAIGRYHEEPTRERRLTVWVVLAYLVFTRPYGVPLVLGWLAYDLFPIGSVRRLNLFPYPKVGWALVAVVVPLTALGLLEQAGLSTLKRWREGILVAFDPSFPTYEFTSRGGETILSFVLLNADHMIVLASLKVLVFLLPVVPRFSTLHNVLNLLTLTPMILLSVITVLRLVRERSQLFRLWVTPMVVILLIVSVTFVDYSWGYRAPAGPIFALLSGYAVATTSYAQRLLAARPSAQTTTTGS